MIEYFYLSCLRENFGGNVVFHATSGGYTTNVSKAKILTREDAQHAWDTGCDFDQPISKSHVDELLVSRVDMQLVSGESIYHPEEKHMIYVQHKYCGNDLYWQGDGCLYLDPMYALEYTTQIPTKIGTDTMIHLPVSIVKKATRHVFREQDFKARTMTQGAGIKIPDHVRRSRRRARNSKDKPHIYATSYAAR